MPVLRSAPDNTLAETLGGLGNSLSNAFNPLNQIRASNLQSEIQQRQWEITHQQTLDAANRNAADVYVKANPFNQDDASLAVSAAKIRNGQGDLEGAINAAKSLKTWQGQQAAAAMIDADPEMANWDAADRANVKSRVLSDPNFSVSDAKKAHALQKGEELKLTTTQGGVSSSTTPLGQEAAALGQPETASKLDAQGRLKGLTGNLTPEQIDQANADRDAAGLPRLPLGTALTAGGQPAADAATAAREAEIARQKGVAKVETEGLPRTGNVFFGPLPGQQGNQTGSPYSPSPLPTPVPPAPPAPSADGTTPAPAAPPVQTPPPDVTIPNAAAPASLPVPVERTVPGGGRIVGETEAEATQRQNIDKETGAQLTDAISGGEAGLQMMATIDRLRTLAKLAQSGGASQVPIWVDSWLRDHGLVMTNRQGILAAMQAEFQAQIPELRKAMGVKFEAGPELSAQAKMIGNPNLPEPVLEGIFGRQAAIAQLAIDRRNLALRAKNPGQAQPLSRTDYLNEDAKIWDNLSQKMKDQIEQYGGYTPQSEAPPPTPTGGGGFFQPFMDWLRHGSQTPHPPQTQTAPPSDTNHEVWDVDANGRPVRVR